MRIGLIDADNYRKLYKCFPNLALMKLSAYHKQQGDSVEWYYPFTGHYDKVYVSKVFSSTRDYEYYIDADQVIRGGSGYYIKLNNGKEEFDSINHRNLPYEVEHIMPDYSLYGISNTAYGFTSRGCPRNCAFCHVVAKEGRCSIKVADITEFWNGQKYIELLDPNTLACKDWKAILQQLIDSKAYVNFDQGLDMRLMTAEKAEYITNVKIKAIHFAWDRYEDKDTIIPKFEMFRKISNIHPHNLQVYCIVGDRERRVLDTDLGRIMWLRNNGYAPYVMIYNKDSLPRGHELKKLQRWVNNRRIFWKCETFNDYLGGE